MSHSDKWLPIFGRKKGKISGCVEKQHFYCSKAMSRQGSRVVSKFLLNLSKGYQCCLFIRKHFLPIEKCSGNFDAMLEPFP